MKEPKRVDGQVRIDTGVRQGDQISTFYDPMISKLIVWGKNRNEAIERLHSALDDYKVVGLPTNIKFMKRVLRNDTFKTGVYDTSFIAKNQAELLGDKPLSEHEAKKRLASIALANVWFENQGNRLRRPAAVDPWNTFDNFRINHTARRDITLQEGEDKSHKLKIEYLSETKFNVLMQTDKLGLENETILKHAEVI